MTDRIVPETLGKDTEDTRWALETAHNLWATGDRREALRWVRRAAEAAAEAGLDDRALELAKSGAELRTDLDIPRTLPPPPAVPTFSAVPILHKEEPQAELVVTIVAEDGSIPARDACFIAHKAVRVAISPLPDDDAKFIVRPLKPGEVASSQATVGLLVAFQPGVSPLPKKQ